MARIIALTQTILSALTALDTSAPGAAITQSCCELSPKPVP